MVIAIPKSELVKGHRKLNESDTIIGDILDPHIRTNLYHLIAEVIGSGMRDEGIMFFKSDTSKWWISISNLDYEYLYRKYKEYGIGIRKGSGVHGRGMY
jgi:hypothetical protein